MAWYDHGPSHNDRIKALTKSLSPTVDVVGLQLFSPPTAVSSRVRSEDTDKALTIFPDRTPEQVSLPLAVFRIVSAVLRRRIDLIFFCHYELPEVFLSACVLRLLGRRVAVMNDSKFDDAPRRFLREALKTVLYAPYQAALVGSRRSAQYLRFLGKTCPIELGYNGLSFDRIEQAAAGGEEPSFAARPFVILARLVKKKNLELAIHAYRLYLERSSAPRPLLIVGGGNLREQLELALDIHDVRDRVSLLGPREPAEALQLLKGALALILPSTEEQFGHVIAEAIALRVPVIVSENCGARDELVRSGVNGFVFEPDNAAGLAYFMHHMESSQSCWELMRQNSRQFAAAGDAQAFVTAVQRIVTRLERGPARNP